MKLQYLGTGAAEGWPAVFCQCAVCRRAMELGGKNLRLRSCALVNDQLLIDVSPDIFAAKLKLKLDLGSVRNVLITHAHMDHFSRENIAMFVEPFAHLTHRSMLNLWGSAFTHRVWDEYACGSLLHESGLSEAIVFHEVKPFETFMAADVSVTALPAVHSCPESFIYVLEQGNSKLLYGNDTGLWEAAVWQSLEAHKETPFTVVSLDSTMGLPDSSYSGHMTFRQNVQIRDQMLSAGLATANTLFICQHFSHNGLLLHEQIEEKMNPLGFTVAYDGMAVEVP